ncbi:universal stress protein [Chryseolinea lacunae]|uniref:Universal stress protein n=1 Tax=Chryseolinea lacunae TaxID=2801331 RepID=A0ABS1KXW7_9BACT|nr:universal stress protein [Chryseolinea lacunae]MBL0744170.1 universal stress protein [Chryseolinea lacunae]
MKILVPLDFSPASLAVLESAFAVAQQFHAQVVLIQVIEHIDPLSTTDDKEQYIQAQSQLMGMAKENLQRHAAKWISDTGLEIETTVKSGVAADEICYVASVMQMNLIIIGTQSQGIHARKLGSTTRRVMEFAPCSVLTIPSSQPRIDFGRILIPILWSPRVLDKFRMVRRLVKMNHSKVLLVGLTVSGERHELRRLASLLDFVCGRICDNQGTCTHKIYDHLVEFDLPRLLNRFRPELLVMTSAVEKATRIVGATTMGQAVDSAYRHMPVLSLRRSPHEMTDQTPLALESSLIDLIRTKIAFFGKRPRLSKGR